MDSPRNKLTMPLAPKLMAYIKHEYPGTWEEIVSTVANVVKDSRNHYLDVMKALEPMLKENTKPFVDKLFMFRKRLCRNVPQCNKPFCLFAHNEEELQGAKRAIGGGDSTATKRYRVENREILLSKVDETRHTVDSIKNYAMKYGSITGVKHLDSGRYVVVFTDTDAARRLMESYEDVLNDSEIKKSFNSPATVEYNRTPEMAQLFDEQISLIDGLLLSFDSVAVEELKAITLKIKNIVLPPSRGNETVPQQTKQEDPEADLETSMFYNMFSSK